MLQLLKLFKQIIVFSLEKDLHRICFVRFIQSFIKKMFFKCLLQYKEKVFV